MLCWLHKIWLLLTGRASSLCCRQVTEFLMAYLDRELEPAVARRFEDHLAACTACRKYLESYQHAVKLGKESLCSQDAPPIPEDLTRAILDARRQAK